MKLQESGAAPNAPGQHVIRSVPRGRLSAPQTPPKTRGNEGQKRGPQGHTKALRGVIGAPSFGPSHQPMAGYRPRATGERTEEHPEQSQGGVRYKYLFSPFFSSAIRAEFDEHLGVKQTPPGTIQYTQITFSSSTHVFFRLLLHHVCSKCRRPQTRHGPSHHTLGVPARGAGVYEVAESTQRSTQYQGHCSVYSALSGQVWSTCLGRRG